jgi:hypothetical protein
LHLASRNAESLEAAKKKLADKYDAKVTVHALDLGKFENMTKLANAVGPVDSVGERRMGATIWPPANTGVTLNSYSIRAPVSFTSFAQRDISPLMIAAN